MAKTRFFSFLAVFVIAEPALLAEPAMQISICAQMSCPGCGSRIKSELEKTPGVTKESVKVLFKDKQVALSYQPSQISQEQLIRLVNTARKGAEAYVHKEGTCQWKKASSTLPPKM